ncbi:integrase core domain-containing protein [Rhodonellum sp.]|uniref:integrase core domain-containing protein n=1 Tax=Rhodonellum sp. TaxID=2231180 RepID=UPI00271E43B5|nr:integrase core domain-containing protein [Rhodonellum sp.]MDO9551409.1 integrase core domain-containing protein [Rhodonellum sp.]
METVESLHALRMALSGLPVGFNGELIHHSDRGIQYCSQAYIKMLEDHLIRISMTENGDPLENAVAERINGIIKEEYLYNYDIDTLKEARDLLSEAVNLYNSERPHMSIGNFTPDQMHHSGHKIKPERLWRNYFQPKIEMEEK